MKPAVRPSALRAALLAAPAGLAAWVALWWLGSALAGMWGR
jgi:hypothetical protein